MNCQTEMSKQGEARALRHQIHAALRALAGAWLTNVGVHRTKIDLRHIRSLIHRVTLGINASFSGNAG